MKVSKSIKFGTFLIYASILIGLWQGVQEYQSSQEEWVLKLAKDSITDDGLFGSQLDLEHFGDEMP